MKNWINQFINGFYILDVKKESKLLWLYVKCPFCDNQKWIRKDNIASGRTKSCGCYNSALHKKNIQGNKYGRLVVLSESHVNKNHQVMWKCQCDCGKTTVASTANLISGAIQSCGCFAKEKKTTTAAIKKREETHLLGTNIKSLLSKTPSNNKSGIKGVCWDNNRSKWRAYITFQNKRYELGFFDNLNDAAKVRKNAEEEKFGNFIEWYNNNKTESD